MTPSDWLTVPGRWLADWIAPLQASTEETEVRADLVVTLGLAAWVVTLLLLALAWRHWGQQLLRSEQAKESSAAAATGLRRMGTAAQRWNWRNAWAMVWRLQVAHLFIYAGAPVLWEFGRHVLLVMALPFSIMGFGDRNGPGGGLLDHLLQPGCWTFGTVCAWPEGNGAVWAKLAWAVLAVSWVAYARRQRRPG